MNKKIICLICCRGGSKTIKNKNIKFFNKKPLLYWSLKNIVASKVFSQIILSTDSKKIVNVANKFNNIDVPGLRPKKLARSDSNQFETHKYIFKKLNINDENSVVCIFNNNPFITSDKIKESFKLFKKNKFKGLVTDATMVDGDYIAWKQCFLKKNSLNYIFKSKFLKIKLNRQKLKRFYVNIFNLRWGKPSFLESYQSYKRQLLKRNNNNIFLNKMENFDLDDLYDWKISEVVHKKFYNAGFKI